MNLYRTLQKYVAWKRRGALARGALRVLGADVAALLALCLLDNLLGWSVGARAAVAIAFWLAQAVVIISLVRSAWRMDRGQRGNARELEATMGIRDNALVNAVCFDQDGAMPEDFKRHFLTEAEGRTAGRHLPPLSADKMLRRLFKGLLWAMAAALLYCLALPRFAANAFVRLMRPRAEVCAINFIRFEMTPPGAQIPYGSALTVQGRAWKDGKPLPEVKLRVRSAGAPPALYSLEDGGKHTFEAVTEELRIALVCRDENSREYRITPVRPPMPRLFLLEAAPPEYTGRPPQQIDLTKEKMPSFLAGTKLRFSTDDSGADMRMEGLTPKAAALPLSITAADSAIAIAKRPFGGEGLLSECWRGEISVQPDRAPAIHFLNAKTNIQAGYGETVELHLAASDDIGVAGIEVTLTSGKRSGLLKHYTYPQPGTPAIRESVMLTLTPEMFSADAPLEVRAAAIDGAGQRGQVPTAIVIHYADLTSLLKESRPEAGGKCYGKLMEALRLQQAQRDYAAAHTKNFAQQDAQRLAREQRQVEERLAEALRDAQAQSLPARFQKELQELLEHDAKALAASARELQKQAKPDAKLLNEIILGQTTLIGKLQRLLGMAGANERRRLEELGRQQELEAEKNVFDAMRELQEKLQRFAEEQRRLKVETEAIDPKAPDDFSENEERLLGDLAVKEDELSKFLKNAFSDFSKKAAQDFSNSTMADEFSEIYEELQRAGKALEAKHIEIATLAEDTALDSAKEVSANIERWLADAKDYIKWNAEEDGMTQDGDLTDLPDELTDIIGDLIDEEDVDDEDVQDSTNSFSYDSDAGLGWTAMDGNIDSMQAKGITGNSLPNNHEVGGRSGEGRSGRSTGQFVEKEATGKGGRKTPTRLVQGAFEAGTVVDKSKDGQGGATGGGKQSGVGGEGLVGVTPDQDTSTGVRTNANFADLRQRTEAALRRLEARQLPTGELRDALEKLRTAEQLGAGGGVEASALGAGAVQSLKNARAAAASAARAQVDERRKAAVESLPAASGSPKEKVPAAFDTLVGEYFKAIAAKKAE